MPQRPTSCVYCGGPLPPPAVTGRPRSFCSAACREANERVVVSQRFEEKQRQERERREAEAARRRREVDEARFRREEREYRRAIEAGGTSRWRRSGKGWTTRPSRSTRAGTACASGRARAAFPGAASTGRRMSTAPSTTASSIVKSNSAAGSERRNEARSVLSRHRQKGE
jgi:hypothetical protein